MTLFTEDDLGPPLPEIVGQSFIRPVPPEDLTNGVVFERGLVVDAYLKYGWRTGVLRGKTKDEKYWVDFNSPRGIVQNLFEKQQLRVHLDWIGLKWVRPDHKELIISNFSSGTMVELRVGFVWVPAVLVKEVDNEKIFIVYVKCFNDYFSCEAFIHSAWRQGLVRGILFEGRYMVSFGKTKVGSQFNHSELRPLMEWEDGVCIECLSQNAKKAPLDGKRNKSVKEPLGNEMADDVVNEKGSGSHVTLGMAATENKPQGKIFPEPMRKQNGLGNE